MFVLGPRFERFSVLQDPNAVPPTSSSPPAIQKYTFADWAKAMSTGRFSRAWQINDVTGNHWPSAHHLGATGNGKHVPLTVRSLHGIGDAVQMLRYAPQLNLLAAHTAFHVPEVLRPIARCFYGVDNLVSEASPTTDSPSPLREVEMSELPYLFRTTVADLPLATNYLRLPSSVVAGTHLLMGRRTKPRIGLVWAGGEWDRERWVPLPLLATIIGNKRFEWWSLQGGPHARDAANLPLRNVLEICGNGLMPLTAAIVNLDLVISVDSLAVHLAGALGKPAWLMLKHHADWRWMKQRSDNPWYPSLRLFRQSSPGEWKNVLSAITEALEI